MSDCPSCKDKKNKTIIHSNGVIKKTYKKDYVSKKHKEQNTTSSNNTYVIKRRGR